MRREEYDEAGRVTAEAYREFRELAEDDPDEAHAWDDYLVRIADVAGRDPVAPVLVAVEDGRIIGTLTLELEDRISTDDHGPLPPSHAHVRMLGVDPDARGHGVARALMDAAIEIARSEGKTLLTLNTTRRMQAAQQLYEAMGFRRDPDRVFPDGFVLLAYSLEI